MLNSSHRPDKHNTLKAVEGEIGELNRILRSQSGKNRFPYQHEQDYILYRNKHFLDVDIKIIIGGMIVYMLFSWSDFYLGGEHGGTIFVYRMLLSLTLLSTLLWLPRSLLTRFIMPLTALGVVMVGASVIYFIDMLEGLAKYAYHLGLVPIQVFAIVSLRLSYRAFLSASSAIFGCYLIAWVLSPPLNDSSNLGVALIALQPFFLVFWLILIALGTYMSYAMERAARDDYVKNSLLELEAQRLQFLTRRLQQLSTTDSLTGLANRRHFEQAFDAEWRRALRTLTPLSVVMIDVDQFKAYNDGYGHQAGDECLRKIAALIQQSCQRSGDLAARYGGEEFVVLLPDTDIKEAQRLAEKIRARIQSEGIEHEYSEFKVTTISAGIACCLPNVECNSEDLLRQADDCLYQAKHAGRNCLRLQQVSSVVAD